MEATAWFVTKRINGSGSLCYYGYNIRAHLENNYSNYDFNSGNVSINLIVRELVHGNIMHW